MDLWARPGRLHPPRTSPLRTSPAPAPPAARRIFVCRIFVCRIFARLISARRISGRPLSCQPMSASCRRAAMTVCPVGRWSAPRSKPRQKQTQSRAGEAPGPRQSVQLDDETDDEFVQTDDEKGLARHDGLSFSSCLSPPFTLSALRPLLVLSAVALCFVPFCIFASFAPVAVNGLADC